MSHDIISDGLNGIMNAKKAGKEMLVLKRFSKLLIEVLKIAKKHGYLDYEMNSQNKELKIWIKKLNLCMAIKPRFDVKVSEIDKYLKRYMPARNFGIIIISTNKGMISHEEAYEKNTGGSLIAYFY